MYFSKDFQELAQKVFNEEYNNGTTASVILGKLELLLERHGYNSKRVWTLAHTLYEKYEASLREGEPRV